MEHHAENKSARRWQYPALLLVVYSLWTWFMAASNSWALFADNWQVSLTMVFGSMIAGATAEGGAAVAFPVFTKVLHIPSSDARTFGLMIQAVGMTTAGVMIWSRRVRVLPHVIRWVTAGGFIGMLLGSYYLNIPNPYPKVLFTFIATTFGVALVISRWVLDMPPRDDFERWELRHRLLFMFLGVIGGAFASQTGSGIDMLTFVVLTLAFGINEKISTPTTVIIMGLNSVVGFFVHGVMLSDIGVVWDYWLVAVPVVVIGAPVGAFIAARISRDPLITLLLSLIVIELVTTIWLIPFDAVMVMITLSAVAVFATWFAVMLAYRQRRARQPQGG